MGSKRRLLSHSSTARLHRLLGILLTVPILTWILSAWMMHYVAVTAPNGLQGEYRLAASNPEQPDLGSDLVSPERILAQFKDYSSFQEVFWLRLDAFGSTPIYLVKPNPFTEAVAYEARTGSLMDPLPEEILIAAANQSLEGTAVSSIVPVTEYHRDYLRAEVPALRIEMTGDQPCQLIIAQRSARTLRRIDGDAASFEWWYRELHVFQWGKTMFIFTSLLYLVAFACSVMALLGFRLFWWRRKRRWPEHLTWRQKAIKWHRRFGLTAGVFLFLQMPVGAYMWLSLGPLEDPFRGKTSINTDWSGGLPVDRKITPPRVILERVSEHLGSTAFPIQSIEWRNLGEKTVWLITTKRNEEAVLFDSESGRRLDTPDPGVIGEIARNEVLGRYGFDFVAAVNYYSNDLNRPIPAYQYRFHDPGETDVFASQLTGQVISRRPAFWRAFLPFFAFHTLTLTEVVWFDSFLLYVVQFALLALVFTGWLQVRIFRS